MSDPSSHPLPNPAGSLAILWTDGAARGNPGPAGIGVMLKTHTGEVMVAEGHSIGHATNNVAEYRALLLGLEKALERDVRRLEVRADSELLIKQLKSEYRVKNQGLRPLFEQASALLRRFDFVRLTHVRRKYNVEADRLANEGIDKARSAPPDAP